MALEKAFIPYGAYWTTPFCRWQGNLSGEHALELAARVAAEALAARKIAAEVLDAVILGITVPQRGSFYGAPWLAGLLGAPNLAGATVSQACATSARVIASAALEVETGARECVLGVLGDRTSNGPHLYYPDPSGPGGRGAAEDWVWDNFNRDPFAKNSMIETAERVAKEGGFSKEQQDEVCLLRHDQYRQALADGRAFQKRYMAAVTVGRGKAAKTVEADEGVFPTTADGLAKLKPVIDGGTITYGTQTFPADGSAGVVVCTRDRAAELSRDRAIPIQILAYGEARAKKGMMPAAVPPAAQQALRRAGVAIGDCKAIKTHNPFAVNDLWFCKETGVAPDAMNRYGCPLVYGHPQAPTGARLVAELVEELAARGGGVGLFAGCAAGDTAMAIVVKVG